MNNIPMHRCKDCKHSFDYHETGANGKPFLCRCKFSKWDIFLNDPACKNFKLRQ